MAIENEVKARMAEAKASGAYQALEKMDALMQSEGLTALGLFAKLDADGDGDIDIDEFMDGLTKMGGAGFKFTRR